MKEGAIMVLTGIAAAVEFVLIPFPFSIGTMAVTVFLGMFAIHRKQKARIAKAKTEKLEKGWNEK